MPLPENDPPEPLDFTSSNNSPLQDPIGTHRPLPTSQGPALNPAAPSFLSRFNLNRDKSDKGESASDKEAKKAEKAERAAEKAAEKEAAKAEKAEKAEKKKRNKAKSKEKDRQPSPEQETSAPQTPRAETPATADTSPSESRKSRDQRSISTANDSTYGDLDRSVSESISGAGAGSSVGKESFMAKLTRKSSSTKFPFNKSGGLFSSSKRGSEGAFTPDAVDEDNDGPAPGAKADSMQGSPMIGSEKEREKGNKSALSWSSIKGKMAKKGDKTPSLSESFDSVDEGPEED